MSKNEPFADSDESPKVNRLKLKNADKPKNISRVERIHNLDEKAKSYVKRQEKFAFLTQELTLAFTEIMNDTVLLSEIGPKQKEIEGLVLNKLLNLANEMNSDDDLPESFGSVGLIALLLKTLLSLRDRLNVVTFEQIVFEKRLKKLEQIIELNKKNE